MSSNQNGFERGILVAAVCGLSAYYGKSVIKSIASKFVSCFFHKIEIPFESNGVLFPKIQTFLKRKAFGGSETVIDNGNDKLKTGCMLTLSPFSLVYVSYVDKEPKIKIFLHRWRQTTNVFLEYMNKMNSNYNSISFYTLSTSNNVWQKAKTLERETLPSLYTSEMLELLSSNIDGFLSNGSHYGKLGKTHKFTLLLYGPNGTGKTHCAKWLAMRYGRDVYVIDPSHYFCDMNDLQKNINSSILSPCQGGILLFEDVDRYFATLYAKEERPNISNFLNLLDGLCTPENIIIVLTANYRGHIPESIRRDGRIDLSVGFPYVDEEIKSKICDIYRVNPDQVTIQGSVTTSELIKKIEVSMMDLQDGREVVVSGELLLRRETSNDSVSVLS